LNTFESFEKQIYTVNEETFDNIALSLFRYQGKNNPVYREFLNNLRISVTDVQSVMEIPFLPISCFKTHTIKTGAWPVEVSFKSSGTTGATTSQHHLRSLDFYLKHSKRCFEHFFGPVKNFHFLALLPSYLERGDSSLVAMIDHFIKESGSDSSGFYLNNLEQLVTDVQALKNTSKTTIVWGVSFALLDLAEKFRPDLSHCMVFETGGMKGRRKEIIREELHEALRAAFNINLIYSEYGMTELLSQAYMRKKGLFEPSPWMKIIGRDIMDPLQKGLQSETCGINVIDLANWNSLAFVETEDLGKVYADGSFEILGRLDNSDVRGCNLLVE
jgi:phenylacetate-coenzyme A ligase PaaK-like adenylate-forming protein